MVPDSCTVRDCAANHLRVDLPSVEQATTLCGRDEPCKGELLRGKLPFYRCEMAFPLEFAVYLDP